MGLIATGCAAAPVPYLKGQKDANDVIGGILAGAAAIAESAMGPDTSTNANWGAKNRNALVLEAAGILAVPTTILLMRSRDANTASAEAGAARALDKDEALVKCLEARKDLVNSRSAAADVAKKNLDNTLKILQDIKDKEAKAAQEAADAAAQKNDPAQKAEKERLEKEAAEHKAVSDAARQKQLEVLKSDNK